MGSFFNYEVEVYTNELDKEERKEHPYILKKYVHAYLQATQEQPEIDYQKYT